jgi:1-phosphofructokinase
VIVTVTPAPAIDWTVSTPHFELGEVNRAQSLFREASGKGLNVAWALHKQGVAALAVFPSGGQGGDFMRHTLDQAGLAYVAVPAAGDVRTNITLRVAGFPETKINTASEALRAAEVDALTDAVDKALNGAEVLMSCGSLPPGAPLTFHKDMVLLGKRAGVMTVVDASGQPLAEAITAGPDLVKPNREELEDITGVRLDTLGDIITACESLLESGVGSVLASLGAYGVVLVDSDGALFGTVSGVSVANAVGAGDALLAGFVAERGERAANLTRALVWASSSVQSESTLFEVDPHLAERVTITRDCDLGLRVVTAPHVSVQP